MFADFLAHQSRKLVIDGMSWSGSDNATLDRFANECHITDDIEQFMACTFVFPLQWFVLDIAEFCSIHAGHLEVVSKLIELFLFYLTFVDNDGIVEVATLDEVGLEQRHDVTYENKSTCR